MDLTCEALASVPMTHTTDEPFAPPMATNRNRVMIGGL